MITKQDVFVTFLQSILTDKKKTHLSVLFTTSYIMLCHLKVTVWQVFLIRVRVFARSVTSNVCFTIRVKVCGFKQCIILCIVPLKYYYPMHMNGQNFFIHKNKRWYPTPFVLNLRSLCCLPRVHMQDYANVRRLVP